jgi:ADP-ribosylglycohydrolase
VHDVIDLRDIVVDEWRELDVSGFDVAALRDPIAEAAASNDEAPLRDLLASLQRAPRRPGWPYEEPSDPAAILSALGVPAAGVRWAGDATELRDRLHGAWLARCVGCVMGKPVEGLPRPALRSYLRAAGAWPLRDYVPLLSPLPAGVERLHESAPDAAKGCFDASPRDDDTDYTVLGLHLLETYGRDLEAADVAREWLDRLPFTQTFTAERATYRNLVHGVPVAAAASVDNPYREWIGALIRADAFGYAFPGDPAAAVGLALVDASLSHRGNGIYGEAWAAALVASAFTAADMRGALEIARSWIPPRSRLREALDLVLAVHERGATWEELEAALDENVGHYDWAHTINNAAGIAAALLWGERDLVTSLGLTIGLGWDTDSSAATVGSVLGAAQGTACVPKELAEPLNDSLRSAIRDFDRSPISSLAERTLAVALSTAKTTTLGAPS